MTDVSVFNIDKEKIAIDDVIQMLSPKIILLFDIESNDIHFPLSLNLNEIQIYNGCEILLAVSLESLFKEEAKSKKRELWKNLKMIFNL